MASEKQCTRDELFERLAELGLVDNFNEEMEWFLSWAERRCGQVAEKLREALEQIASDQLLHNEQSAEDHSVTVRFLAKQALKKYTYKEKNDGKRQHSKRN
jgi:hypothetical protein